MFKNQKLPRTKFLCLVYNWELAVLDCSQIFFTEFWFYLFCRFVCIAIRVVYAWRTHTWIPRFLQVWVRIFVYLLPESFQSTSIANTWLPRGSYLVYSYAWRARGVPKHSQMSMILSFLPCVLVNLACILQEVNVVLKWSVIKNRTWKLETSAPWPFTFSQSPVYPAGRSIILLQYRSLNIIVSWKSQDIQINS